MQTNCSINYKCKVLINHVLIDRRHGLDIQDVRSYRGADADSDHLLVKIKYKQRISIIQNSQTKRQKHFNNEKLIKEPLIAEAYQKIA